VSDYRIYSPLPHQVSLGYSHTETLRDGRPQCRSHVRGERWGGHQCCKPGAVQVDGYWFCKIHDPEAARKRQEESSRKEREAYQKRMVSYAAPRLLRVLEEIASGHNDPRSLEAEAIKGLTTQTNKEEEA